MCKFPSQLIFITCALVLFAVPILNLGAAFGREATKTYRCTAKDAVAVEPDGTLSKDDPGAKFAREHFDRMVITVPSGSISYPNSGTLETRVIQRTSVADDYVLIPSVFFRRTKGAANATTDFIFLHVATGIPQAIFSAKRLSYLVTGTCDIVP